MTLERTVFLLVAFSEWLQFVLRVRF